MVYLLIRFLPEYIPHLQAADHTWQRAYPVSPLSQASLPGHGILRETIWTGRCSSASPPAYSSRYCQRSRRVDRKPPSFVGRFQEDVQPDLRIERRWCRNRDDESPGTLSCSPAHVRRPESIRSRSERGNRYESYRSRQTVWRTPTATVVRTNRSTFATAVRGSVDNGKWPPSSRRDTCTDTGFADIIRWKHR